MIYLLKRFWKYARVYKLQYVYAFIGVLMVSGGTAGITYLIKPVMDKVFIEKDEKLLYLLPIAIIVIMFLKSFGRFVQTYYTVFVGQRVLATLKNELLKNLLNQDMDFFNKTQKGKLISRVLNDTSRIERIVSTSIPLIIREVMTALGLLGVVIYHSPKLAFFSLIVIPFSVYPLSKLAKKMKKISRSSQEKIADVTSRLSEIFNNIEIIKSSVSEKFEYERFKNDNEKFFNLIIKATKTNALVAPLMEFLGGFGVAVVIVIGGRAVFSGEMSVGEFFSFITSLFMIYTPIKFISNEYNRLQDAIVAGERIFEYIDLKPDIKSCGNKELSFIKRIEFKDVKLKYGDKEALKGINLTANEGESVALVGDSGGGKSSLVNLLVRFYESSSGEILINGQDIKEYDIKSLRKNIAFVTQRVFIFTLFVGVVFMRSNKPEKPQCCLPLPFY